MRRGISILLATLIIIATSIAVIASVILWVKSTVYTTEEQFMIRPMIVVVKAAPQPCPGGFQLILYIVNKGSIRDRIVRVVVEAGGGSYVNSTVIDVPPVYVGEKVISGWVVKGRPSPIESKNMYRVFIYLEKQGPLIYPVTAY